MLNVQKDSRIFLPHSGLCHRLLRALRNLGWTITQDCKILILTVLYYYYYCLRASTSVSECLKRWQLDVWRNHPAVFFFCSRSSLKYAVSHLHVIKPAETLLEKTLSPTHGAGFLGWVFTLLISRVTPSAWLPTPNRQHRLWRADLQRFLLSHTLRNSKSRHITAAVSCIQDQCGAEACVMV